MPLSKRCSNYLLTLDLGQTFITSLPSSFTINITSILFIKLFLESKHPTPALRVHEPSFCYLWVVLLSQHLSTACIDHYKLQAAFFATRHAAALSAIHLILLLLAVVVAQQKRCRCGRLVEGEAVRILMQEEVEEEEWHPRLQKEEVEAGSCCSTD